MDDSAMGERYRALLLAARNLFSLTNLEDLVENILKYSRTMMHSEACSMFLPDHASHELILYSARGKADSIHQLRMPWDKGIAGAVFQSRKFERVDDAQNDPRLLRAADTKTGFLTRAMLCAPLVDKDECFGVLQALNPIGRVTFTELDKEIFEGLTSIVTGALVRFDRELKITHETQLARELTLALEIQKSFLPPEELVLPRSEMRVHYRAARTIGGDFYSSIVLPNDRLLVALGDVSGKGIPAALTTAQISSEMQALAPVAEQGLDIYVTTLNAALCQRLAAGRFAATTFLLYDPNRECMEVLCAGQFEPWRWHEEKWEPVKAPRNLALGIFPKYEAEITVFPCMPGEKWLLFTDGINEGRSPSGEDYGFERLQASLGAGSPTAVLERAWQAWVSFVDGVDQHDDACLALIATKPDSVLQITSCAQNCKQARNFIENWSLTAGFSDLERGQIVLAADEAVTNVIRHTYKSMPDCPITLSAEVADDLFHLRLRDYGPPVDAAELKGRKLEDVKPGGLGLHLLNTIFTVVEHRALDDGNEWHLAKPVPGSAAPAETVPAGA
jgi:sigma-B regulation protein RsbU (phosphoserine phosphatase)